MKVTLIISVLLTALGFTLVQPNTVLQGKVIDEIGEPVLFATVVLYKDSVLITGTDTDFDGNYSFSDLSPGEYEVEMTYIGLQRVRENVAVKGGEVTVFDAVMKESGEILDCIQVVSYQVPLLKECKTTSGSVVTKSRKRIGDIFKKKDRATNVEGLPTKAISAIAATSAGISVSENGNISVRGGRTPATFYYIDGVRVDASSAANMIPQAQITELALPPISGVPATQENEKSEETSFDDLQDEEEPSITPEVSTAEGYNKPEENPFVSPLIESHSTFALDVDKAAYSNVRRMITNGQLPPPAAVRVEEMVNYFDYSYAQPTAEHPIVVHHNLTECPWNNSHQLLHLSMKAKEVDLEDLPPSNLVFLVDVSGSMNSANKLPLVKQSLKLLLDELRPEDRVAIVTYAGSAGVVLPSTSAKDKKAIIASLDRLHSGGGTAGAQGIITAYDIAKQNFVKKGNNRVILATDGDFNVGVNSAGGLEKLIEKKRKTGIYLSVLGFGMGNYQDHKMQTLANKGNGNHAYIDNLQEAKKIFVKEFSGTLFTIAKDVKIQIEFNPAHVQSYRLIGYENRMLATEDFNDDTKDAGEVGAGHTVTAVYELIPHGSDSDFVVAVSDKQVADSRSGKQADPNQALAYIKCRYKQPDGEVSTKFEDRIPATLTVITKLEEDIQFSVAVAEFGMYLSQSKFLKTTDLNTCLDRAKKNMGKDKEGYRYEFVQLVEDYKKLMPALAGN